LLAGLELAERPFGLMLGNGGTERGDRALPCPDADDIGCQIGEAGGRQIEIFGFKIERHHSIAFITARVLIERVANLIGDEIGAVAALDGVDQIRRCRP